MRRAAAALIAVIALLVAIGLVRAQPPGCQQGEFALSCTTYAPVVIVPPPTRTSSPTPAPPTPTPVPPPLSAIVLQPADVSSDYLIDEFREFKNDEAAKGYANPKAALVAFAQQGRESSWIARYFSAFDNPLGISDQGIRYLTEAGADAGLEYVIADVRADHPDAAPFSFSVGDRTVALSWGFISNGHAYNEYYYAIRKGRYITLVWVIGYQADLTVSIANVFARKSEARLP